LERADGRECFFGLLLRPGICPNYTAHLFHVQTFWEWFHGRNGEKGKKAIQIIGRCRDQVPVPFYHVGRFAQLEQHWAAVDHIDGMKLEGKRSYDAEISAATAKRPKQIGILIGIRFYKFAVG